VSRFFTLPTASIFFTAQATAVVHVLLCQLASFFVDGKTNCGGDL